ncbi:M28 family peptidase [Saccharopolyspora spinosa]|uniref:M28 family peptidase n=1 Tax=Saccharopolyspora spinosa TaxID=60894 RepID=UPI003747993A
MTGRLIPTRFRLAAGLGCALAVLAVLAASDGPGTTSSSGCVRKGYRSRRSVGARSSAGLATFGRADNVVATLPGTASTGTVLLAAHYDSASVGPGASDDLLLLIIVGEEEGSLGAEGVRPGASARQSGRSGPPAGRASASQHCLVIKPCVSLQYKSGRDR